LRVPFLYAQGSGKLRCVRKLSASGATMTDLILILLFFGGGMLFGLLLYADAIEE
jgi:hypothetical protein